MHLTRSMEFNEMKENGLAKKKKKLGRDQYTVVFIKRGEDETLHGVEIKKCSCSMVCAASYAVQYINCSLEKILCAFSSSYRGILVVKQPELKPERHHLPNLLNLKTINHLINKDMNYKLTNICTKAYNAVPKAAGDISCISVL